MKCPHCKGSIIDFIFRGAPSNPKSDNNVILPRIYAFCCPECNVIISINNYSGT
ncbi:MAG: hypothetical protein ACXADY_04030 [Candidatus Hodarchaeales archaeon]|jgi:hypothetical protein